MFEDYPSGYFRDTAMSRFKEIEVGGERVLRKICIRESTEFHDNEIARLTKLKDIGFLYAPRIYGAGWEEDEPYIDMELVPGRNLAWILNNLGFDLERDGAFLPHMIMAHHYLHVDGKMLHRDIKLDNVVSRDYSQPGDLSSVNVPVILDFGLAGEFGERSGGEGRVMGTPEYMSPELCRGMCLDVRSDVYSLGVVLYALLTGRVPFNHKFFKSAVVRMQVEDTPIAPYVRKPEIPRKLSDVVMKSLKKDPDDRYNNCMAFAEAVANAA